MKRYFIMENESTLTARTAPWPGILAVLAGLAVGGSALAATQTPMSAPVVQAVIGCKSIADPTERLACFDKAVGAMADADAKGDLVTLDHEQRRTVRRQAFGLTLPALSMFDRGEKPEEAHRASYTVVQAWTDAEGKWMFKLDTGAVWRQTDDNALMKSPHQGSVADISTGALGSFFMKVDGQLSIRVHRDN